MGLAARGAPPEEPFDHDQVVHLRGATWEDYERLLAIRGEKTSPRITFCEGLLEIMSPGRPHESTKSIIGRLVEAYCLDRDIEFWTLGGWTLKESEEERGAEGDECWTFRHDDGERWPDVVVEVVFSNRAMDKLEVYRKLGVPEVWIYRDGALTPYLLRGERYERAERSEVLPDLDLVLLVSCLDGPSTSACIRAFRTKLRAEPRW